jgi:hypothetical protein
MAYDILDPIGEVRSEGRTAKVLSMMMNLFMLRFGKRPISKSKLSKPADFMPDFEKAYDEMMEEPQQDVEEMKQQITWLGSIFGSNPIKKPRGKKKKEGK